MADTCSGSDYSPAHWFSGCSRALRRAAGPDRYRRTGRPPLDELSGGQPRARLDLLGRHTGTEILLLDEPTTYLEPARTLEVLGLGLVERLHADPGRTVARVPHIPTRRSATATGWWCHTTARWSPRTPRPISSPRPCLRDEEFGLRAQVWRSPIRSPPGR